MMSDNPYTYLCALSIYPLPRRHHRRARQRLTIVRSHGCPRLPQHRRQARQARLSWHRRQPQLPRHHRHPRLRSHSGRNLGTLKVSQPATGHPHIHSRCRVGIIRNYRPLSFYAWICHVFFSCASCWRPPHAEVAEDTFRIEKSEKRPPVGMVNKNAIESNPNL